MCCQWFDGTVDEMTLALEGVGIRVACGDEYIRICTILYLCLEVLGTVKVEDCCMAGIYCRKCRSEFAGNALE